MFAPTVSSSCVRLLSAIACEYDLEFWHFDVDQTFVQSDLVEDAFLRLPKGCGDLSEKVVRLNRGLYGLKQASRTWHTHLTICLKRLGFEQCMSDVCVFPLIEDGRVAMTAVVHMMIFFSRSTTGGGRGCHNFVSILGGDGAKTAPPGDILDQSAGKMSSFWGKLANHVEDHV